MFCEAKHLDLFMPGISVLGSLERTSLNEDQVEVAVSLSMQECTRLCIMKVSEEQSLRRPALLHGYDLNLASEPKLPYVTEGDKMSAGQVTSSMTSLVVLSL